MEYLTGEQVSVEKGSTIVYKENTNNEENKRLDILALEESVQSNKSEIQMAKAPNLPTIELQNTYSKHDFDYPIATENLKEQSSVQLSMQWKIFDFASTSSNAQAAYLNYLSKNSELSYAKYKAKASFKNAQNSYKTSLAKIEAAKAKLQASEMTYELIKKKFQQGIVNNVSYLDALSDKFNSNSQLQTALNEVEYQKAVLLYEMGENIKGAIQ